MDEVVFAFYKFHDASSRVAAYKGNEVVENLSKAYFLEGKNLGDINCLIEIGMQSGLTKIITSTVFENNKEIKIVPISINNGSLIEVSKFLVEELIMLSRKKTNKSLYE